ncbi:4-hydroxy-tetrahydrodipicolinate reductase [Garciella nitratireducens]|uniref:4-hydroxy-tetrahydrodipicolinate reductase n=1 Tax=Garciella nitratireducens TaxID=218205 RepID=UPI000E027B6C|nr:dihydrodipicolinate reductase C-terminal domain-containing protein [Garciella nitratireducens]RBP39891.1 4-hydroxy-tetrahydrodipicolinate reductase [Garciella nitratireducens]
MKIKVGMFGFGKTGTFVAKEILKDPECELKWIIRKSKKNEGEYAGHLLGFDQKEGKIFSSQSIQKDTFYKDHFVDVIIDFSSMGGVELYKNAVKYGIRIVSAISNYDEIHLELLKKLSQYTAILYSPNITLGINFLIKASREFQEMIPNADTEIIEEHFKDKKDVSGTALRIAKSLNLDPEKQISSIRAGGIIGKHEVVFGLPNETIRIVHESINKNAFGQGAIYAAKWLMAKEIGLYTMEEALEIDHQKDRKDFKIAK